MHRLLSAALSALLALAVVAALALPARAEASIDQLEVASRLAPDGSLQVAMVLDGEDLGGEVRQTIDRRAPLGDLREFEYGIRDVAVTTPGVDLDWAVEEDRDVLIIAFDPAAAAGAPITISYTVDGTVHTPSGQAEQRRLSWPIVQGLNLGVLSVSGTVDFISPPPDFDCQAGDPAALRTCALWSIHHQSIGTATFQDGPLAPGDVVVVSASQPADVVADSSTVHTRWTLDQAFRLDLTTALASLAILLLGGLGLWLWHRRSGRDQVPIAGPTVIAEFHPVGDGISEFRLLQDLRPGQIGTVADEMVDPVDVTATILDLAVRGFLRIEQLDVPGGLDWSFARREGADVSELHAYERTLLDAIAPPSGEPVTVSGIQQAVGPVVGRLQHELYDDVVAHGWFTKHPESARIDSRAVGGGLLVVGLVATGLLAWLTDLGLIGVAVVAVGVASLFVAGEMPRRSRSGSALLAGLHGLAAILAQQRTDAFPPGRELAGISRVLPYAVVLGGKDRWIAAMVQADRDDTPDPDALDWYHAPNHWHLRQLPRSLDSLIAAIQGHLFGR